MKKETKKEEYVLVPVGWFERLIEMSNMHEDYVKGYISSAKTILKNNKRTTNINV